jgi:hypothetical protein
VLSLEFEKMNPPIVLLDRASPEKHNPLVRSETAASKSSVLFVKAHQVVRSSSLLLSKEPFQLERSASLLSKMGFFKRSKQRKAAKAALSRSEIEDELQKLPPRLHVQKSGRKSNLISRPLVGPNSTKPKDPMLVDYGMSENERQRMHMQRLFSLSEKLVDATPPERRQSLVTEATVLSSHTPPGPMPFVSRADQGKVFKPQVVRKTEKKTEPRDVPTVRVPTTTSCSMFEMFSGLDSLCGPSRASNDADKAGILADPLEQPYQVPHEISFTKKEGRGSFKSSDAYSVVQRLAEVSNRPPSLLERLTMKKKTAIKSKVYVQKPSSNSSAASVDHSLLTTPSIAAGR